MYVTAGIWLIPFVVSCGLSYWYRLFVVTPVAWFCPLFFAEPVLAGSAFAGVKGLRRASSILRWIGAALLVAPFAAAVVWAAMNWRPVRFIVYLQNPAKSVLMLLLCLAAHIGAPAMLLRWGRRRF